MAREEIRSDPTPVAVRNHLTDDHRRRTMLLGSYAFLRATTGWALLLAAVILAPWWAKIPLAVVNGIVISTLFLVGHDAAHGSLFPRRWMNRWAGRISLLPSLHPYSAWVHSHNRLHHAFTNIKEKDPGFPPLSPAEYASLSRFGRWLHRRKRTWYGIGLFYFLDMWVKWEVFPTRERIPKNPRAYQKDRALVFAFAAVWITCLGWYGWESGDGTLEMILVGFVLPQMVWNWLIGFVILQQHTNPRVAWYSDLDFPSPTYFDGQVRATPHVGLAPAMRVVIRHIMEHTAHHADPMVPHYRLASAQTALEKAYPHEILRESWSLRRFLKMFRICRLYDYAEHRWCDYDGKPLTGKLFERSSESTETPVVIEPPFEFRKAG
jgi:omega-6 fatty acid desaturase (delta-12 desaturase)